jgi:hypothetical protein
MNQIKTELSRIANPLAVAELRSIDGGSRIRISFMGYEFGSPKNICDADWCRILFEFESSRICFRRELCSFDAWSFVRAIESIKEYSAVSEISKIILEPPYGADIVMSLSYKKGQLKKKVWMPFLRDRHGIFVRLIAHFGPYVSNQFDIQFKVNRCGVLAFEKGLRAAVNLLPIRDIERARRLKRIADH